MPWTFTLRFFITLGLNYYIKPHAVQKANFNFKRIVVFLFSINFINIKWYVQICCRKVLQFITEKPLKFASIYLFISCVCVCLCILPVFCWICVLLFVWLAIVNVLIMNKIQNRYSFFTLSLSLILSPFIYSHIRYLNAIYSRFFFNSEGTTKTNQV